MRNKSTLFAAVLLLGCTTTKGPAPVLSSKGPLETAATTGVAKKFIDSHTASFNAINNAALSTQLAKDGFAFIYANCNDYFLSAGDSQKWVIFSRDTVGAVGTLASGIMALRNSSPVSAGYVALTTGAIFGGLDIYTKNFLFSAENISSVQALTNRALDVHRIAVLESGVDDYNGAVTAIIDNQNICSPMHIASLAKEAIKNGTVVASSDPADALGAIAGVQDQAVLEKLGELLNPPGALSIDQAGALWWLIKEASTADERKNFILPQLSGLPTGSIPLDSNGQLKPAFSTTDIAAALSKFSTKTQSSIRSVIASTRAEAAKQAAAVAAAGGAGVAGAAAAPKPATLAVPKFTLPRSDSRPQHIGVKVR